MIRATRALRERRRGIRAQGLKIVAVSPEERLRQLQIELPQPPTPLARYVPAVLSGNLLFISGQLPLREGVLVAQGRLGAEVSLEAGVQAARTAAINALAATRSALGSLDRVARIVRLVGHVAATADFVDHPRVVDGASELLAEVFGEQGRHARVALGAVSLPLGAPVELELIVEVNPSSESRVSSSVSRNPEPGTQNPERG